jgi:hypothetical protein
MFGWWLSGAGKGTGIQHSLTAGQNVIVTMSAKRSQLPAMAAMVQRGAKLRRDQGDAVSHPAVPERARSGR